MPIVRRTRAEIDEAKLLAKLAARPRPSEDEIEAQVAEGWRCVDQLGVGRGRPDLPAAIAGTAAGTASQAGADPGAIRPRHGATIRARPGKVVRAGSDAASRN